MNQLDLEKPFSQSLGEMNAPNEAVPSQITRTSIRKSPRRTWAMIVLITYLVGLGSGYLVWGKTAGRTSLEADRSSPARSDMEVILDQVNPPDGYELPIRYGDFAPKLVAAGVIDYEAFVKLYQDIGSPLTSSCAT